MTFQSQIASVSEAPLVRSAHSVAFEAIWRALPRDGLVPARAALRPERAARFLTNLVLCDVILSGAPALRVRLAGSAFEARVQCSMKGRDYLEYFPGAHRARALENARLLVEQPCGRWGINPVHYERGYAQNVEVTSFPLAPSAGDPPHVLMLTLPMGAPIAPLSTGGKVIAAHAPIVHRFLDLGAGVPAEPGAP